MTDMALFNSSNLGEKDLTVLTQEDALCYREALREKPRPALVAKLLVHLRRRVNTLPQLVICLVRADVVGVCS